MKSKDLKIGMVVGVRKRGQFDRNSRPRKVTILELDYTKFPKEKLRWSIRHKSMKGKVYVEGEESTYRADTPITKHYVTLAEIIGDYDAALAEWQKEQDDRQTAAAQYEKHVKERNAEAAAALAAVEKATGIKIGRHSAAWRGEWTRFELDREALLKLAAKFEPPRLPSGRRKGDLAAMCPHDCYDNEACPECDAEMKYGVDAERLAARDCEVARDRKAGYAGDGSEEEVE